jgi:hypothetical protein
MTRISAKRAAPAKLSTEQVIGVSRSDHRWFLPVLAEIKLIFPRKLAAELAAISNRSERICQVWISRRGAPDGEALAALINSRLGDRVLLALTGACPHQWRRKLNRQIEISRLRDQQRETQLRLEALERGET